MQRLILMLALLCAVAVARAELLPNDYEKMSYAQALERIKAQPHRHIMLYFGLETHCPPCVYTRGLLTGGTLKALYKPHYIVVQVDLRQPGAENLKVIEKYKARWAPTLVFLNAAGKEVAFLRKGFKNEREAILTHEFISQKLYARSDLEAYVQANFNATGAQRNVPETRQASAVPPDSRPRLRDVLGQPHERVAGEALRALLPGMRMEKENQDWFLTLQLAPSGAMHGSGHRKDGKGKMKGEGKWYVTKKGKLCVELKSSGADETWCRHVFRVGENYYYAVKDLRPDRLAYRFTLEKT